MRSESLPYQCGLRDGVTIGAGWSTCRFYTWVLLLVTVGIKLAAGNLFCSADNGRPRYLILLRICTYEKQGAGAAFPRTMRIAALEWHRLHPSLRATCAASFPPHGT